MEGFRPTYPSQLVLPGLGHPELRNSEQHNPEKGGERKRAKERVREKGGGGNRQQKIIYKIEYVRDTLTYVVPFQTSD